MDFAFVLRPTRGGRADWWREAVHLEARQVARRPRRTLAAPWSSSVSDLPGGCGAGGRMGPDEAALLVELEATRT